MYFLGHFLGYLLRYFFRFLSHVPPPQLSQRRHYTVSCNKEKPRNVCGPLKEQVDLLSGLFPLRCRAFQRTNELMVGVVTRTCATKLPSGCFVMGIGLSEIRVSLQHRGV